MDWRNVKKFVVGEPYDAEVEYLESNGTQTLPIPNLYPTPNVIDVQVTGGANQTIAAVGAAGRIRKVWTNANGEYAVFGTASGDTFGISGSLRKTIEISLPRRASPAITATIDGVTKTGRVSGSSSVNGINVFGTSVFGFGTLRLYGVDHYKLVRVGQVGCLYDPETGAFIYPSTGTLACGPDTRVINRQEIVKISSGSMVLWKKPVPYDSEVEYLESDGNSYINTGIVGSSSIDIDSMWRRGTDGANGVLGSRIANADSEYGVVVFNDAAGANVGNVSWRFGTANQQASYVGDGTITIVTSGSVMTANDVEIALQPQTFNSGYPISIFGLNNAGTTVASNGARLYYLKIYENGTLVRDFHPVRVGTTGYLFDRISWTLFGNAGTGNFGYGADVPSA